MARCMNPPRSGTNRGVCYCAGRDRIGALGDSMSRLPVVTQSGARRALPLYLATAAPVEFGDGFFPEERDRSGAFRWMAQRGELRFSPAPRMRYLELVFYCEFHDLSQWVEARCGSAAERLQLGFGWTTAAVEIPAGSRA